MQFRFWLAQMKWRAYSPGAASQPNSERRKWMAVARLGGRGGEGRKKRRFFGALRKQLRLRWLWLGAVYRRALRRLRANYEKALHELVVRNVLVGALHAPAGVDCAHAASFGHMAAVRF